MAETTMLRMMERHTVFDALFLAHQTALLDRDFAAARRLLAHFGETLFAHMGEEESRILPLYQSRAPQPPGGGTQMFLDEHRKIRELVADLDVRLLALGERPEPKAILKLLDQETLFKNYLDHHDKRERAFLYPGLDSVLQPEERRALLTELGL